MKRLLSLCLFAILVCFAATAFAADAQNLVGTWEGTPSVHGAKAYFMASKKKDKIEKFSGTIRSDGQIFIADHDEGYMLGDMTKNGEMELQYGHRGKNAIAVYVLLKKK
ncbi:MAG: hypothetical protein CVU73_09395 [Deltaproteobacteria bacterium HGW-Deltaproteobacteria-8]|jgi:hypothetical protein|nr:MAG: hypothetical protein CVU73_09395 [Deltaproteobacteria bacterium HGW-Deltaproteobacteria-8]